MEVKLSDIIKLIPGQVDLAVLEQIFRSDASIQLDQNVKPAVDTAVEIVRRAANGKDAVYGVNTGFGKLASVAIPPEDTATLQRNLILSHCSGVGDALPNSIVRLTMVLKVMSLARGASGVRWQVIELLQAMINKGVMPVIPAQGSVGASGDLAPLAHMSSVMIGEGRAKFNGTVMTGAQALAAAELTPAVLGPKEGLGLINGTQVSTALALAGLFDAWQMAMTTLVTASLSTDAMMGSTAPLTPELHALRGHKGQIDAAIAMRKMLSGSQIRESHRDDDERVQDPYCIRCQPQVVGAVIDLLRDQARMLEIEANAVTDNPLIIASSGKIISGGNFHAEPVAFAADIMALAIAEIGSISQRRIALLVDPVLSYGLPAFLTPKPGLNSGFMIAEVTAAALMSENKQKAAPCSVDSTPTSANQEDHVSMACHGARRLLAMNDNLGRILGIELMVAVQGVGFRAPLKTSDFLQNVIVETRKFIPQLQDDRELTEDIENAANLVRSDSLLAGLASDALPKIKGVA
ncbi:MAG: histidine ammonia-lyase [Rhizobiaceae bacterium]